MGTEMDLFVCGMCFHRNKRVVEIDEYPCPAHPECRCIVYPIQAIPAGSATFNGLDGADWTLSHIGKLPNEYMTKKEARKRGWNAVLENLAAVCPGAIIGGDIYHNYEGLLPHKDGRLWYEADINYTGGYRGADRIFYSNDGLLFVTYDHGTTFYEILK